jgi:hypothetical protein
VPFKLVYKQRMTARYPWGHPPSTQTHHTRKQAHMCLHDVIPVSFCVSVFLVYLKLVHKQRMADRCPWGHPQSTFCCMETDPYFFTDATSMLADFARSGLATRGALAAAPTGASTISCSARFCVGLATRFDRSDMQKITNTRY